MKITAKEKREFDLDTTSSTQFMFEEAQAAGLEKKGLHADYSSMCNTMHCHFQAIDKPVNVIKFLKEKLDEPKFQVRLSYLTAVWPGDHLVVTGSTRGIDVRFRNASSRADQQRTWNELTLAITGKPGTWT